MKCFSSEEMRNADRDAIAQGTPGRILMSRACAALAEELYFFADAHPRHVVIVAGPGNNGGDGFGLAIKLLHLGWRVSVWVAASRDRIQGDARGMLEQAESIGVPLRWMDTAEDWQTAVLDLPPGSWVVDALLGTGVTEAPRNAPAAAVTCMRQAAEHFRIWSVDVPSGLNPDTGEPFDPELCVRADCTLTLGGPKQGFIQPSALSWTGSVSVLDIGLDVAGEPEPGYWGVVSDREIRDALPSGDDEEHKGSRGHCLFIGGSPGMSGSVSMSAMAALRAGAGLSTVLAPFTTVGSIDAYWPEIMVLPGIQGHFMTLKSQEINFRPFRAVCMGPGLGVNPDTEQLVVRVMNECQAPLVMDADGLNVLAREHLRVGHPGRPAFLTPHPGEMGRLLDKSTSDIQADRAAAVSDIANRSDAHVVLKGARSRIVNPCGTRWINLSGNRALATAGTGDILAGILTGLIARGVPNDLALPVAVALHGRAGELAAIRKGISSVIAGDVLDALPEVFRHAEGR